MEEENFWNNFLEQEFKKDYFKSIKKRLVDDNNSGKKYIQTPHNFLNLLSSASLRQQKLLLLVRILTTHQIQQMV